MRMAFAIAGAIAVTMPQLLSAQVIISEIMYDVSGSDSGREWVEIYNEGADADITAWKLLEGTTNHGLTAVGAQTLSSGSYAVIADNPTKFKTDWPSYSGLLFDSAFSLNNTGETLMLRCCGKELADKDSATYASSMGAQGDGSSLSRSGGSFVPTDPSPGAPPSAAKPEPAPAPKSPEPAPTKQKLPEPAPAAKPAPQPEAPQTKTEAEPVAHIKQPLPEPQESPISAPASASQKNPARSLVSDSRASKGSASVKSPVQKIDRAPISADSEPELPVEETPAPKEEVLVAAAAEAVSEVEGTGQWTWWLGAGALSVAGAALVSVIQRRNKREWDLIEDV